jgi:hypothetical protein
MNQIQEVRLSGNTLSKTFRLLSKRQIEERLTNLEGQILKDPNSGELCLRTRVKGISGKYVVIPFKIVEQGVVKTITQKHDHENYFEKYEHLSKSEFFKEHSQRVEG